MFLEVKTKKKIGNLKQKILLTENKELRPQMTSFRRRVGAHPG